MERHYILLRIWNGGEGGKDYINGTYDRKKKGWSEPENLGPTINTDGNEMFPYLSK